MLRSLKKSMIIPVAIKRETHVNERTNYIRVNRLLQKKNEYFAVSNDTAEANPSITLFTVDTGNTMPT